MKNRRCHDCLPLSSKVVIYCPPFLRRRLIAISGTWFVRWYNARQHALRIWDYLGGGLGRARYVNAHALLIATADRTAQSLAFSKPFEEAREAAAAYYDAETGFTFSEYKVAYTLTANVVVRIATPSTAVAGTPYPIVLQVVVPNGVGWGGIAWAGNMIRNPLTVAWANGNSPVLSSRWAT